MTLFLHRVFSQLIFDLNFLATLLMSFPITDISMQVTNLPFRVNLDPHRGIQLRKKSIFSIISLQQSYTCCRGKQRSQVTQNGAS